MKQCHYHLLQKRLYCHVACFPASDLAGRVFSVREQVGLARWGRPYDTWLHQMDRHFGGGGDGSCGGLEDGHQEPKGVPLEGRSRNMLLRRMLPLTD